MRCQAGLAGAGCRPRESPIEGVGSLGYGQKGQTDALAGSASWLACARASASRRTEMWCSWRRVEPGLQASRQLRCTSSTASYTARCAPLQAREGGQRDGARASGVGWHTQCRTPAAAQSEELICCMQPHLPCPSACISGCIPPQLYFPPTGQVRVTSLQYPWYSQPPSSSTI